MELGVVVLLLDCSELHVNTSDLRSRDSSINANNTVDYYVVLTSQQQLIEVY